MKAQFLKIAGVKSEAEFYKKFPSEEAFFNAYPEAQMMRDGGNVPTNPALWSRAKAAAKAKYTTYPSAYANGFAAKWYKSKGGGWKKAEYGMEVMAQGGTNNPGFRALPEPVQAQILSNMAYGGYMPEMGMGGMPCYECGGMYKEGGEPNGEMALGQMNAVQDKMSKLLQFVKPDDNLDPWIASKLAVMDHSADAIADYMMYGPEGQSDVQPEQMKDGGIPTRYKNMGFNKVGVKKNSTRPGKKWMVLAKKGDDYKVVHGGYDGMKDYTQHGSEKRREKFWNRMGGKNSAKAKDPFSPLYWHKKLGTWEDGGTFSGNTYYQTGGPVLDYETWKAVNMKTFGAENTFQEEYQQYVNANKPLESSSALPSTFKIGFGDDGSFINTFPGGANTNPFPAATPTGKPLTAANLNTTITTTTTTAPKKIKGIENYYKLNMGVDLAKGLVDQFKKPDTTLRYNGMSDNLFPVLSGNQSGSQGNYAVTGSAYGQFRPDEMGSKSPEGMYNGMYYPSMQDGGSFADKYQVSVDTITDSNIDYNMLNAATETSNLAVPSEYAEKSSTPSFDVNKTANVKVNSTAKDAFNYYVEQHNLDPNIAAGIVGNLYHESGLKPKAVEKGNTGNGRGIAQWDVRDRWQGLLKWAEKSGRDPYNLTTQLDYVLVEPGESSKALKKMSKAKTAAEAAMIFGRSYERPNERLAAWDRRTSVANRLVNSSQYKDGGEYTLTADQIKQIMARGGEIEFI